MGESAELDAVARVKTAASADLEIQALAIRFGV